MIYYNEIDDFAIDWLSNLIMEGYLPKGIIDPRPIQEVTPKDLHGFPQCHFFAGIGGWAYALELAGWPEDEPVWTGSCPCQPFSVAGRRRGTDDERHLWPEFRRLIAECNPPAVFGEQVASKAGRDWLSGVRVDLEELGYAVGGADLCAAGVGAPHIRQRLYWCAESGGERLQGFVSMGAAQGAAERNDGQYAGMDEARERGILVHDTWGAGERLRMSLDRGMGYRPVLEAAVGLSAQSGICALAHGVSNRVGLLRGYGNAIVPQVAAEFICAYREAT